MARAVFGCVDTTLGRDTPYNCCYMQATTHTQVHVHTGTLYTPHTGVTQFVSLNSIYVLAVERHGRYRCQLQQPRAGAQTQHSKTPYTVCIPTRVIRTMEGVQIAIRLNHIQRSQWAPLHPPDHAPDDVNEPGR